MHTVAIGGRNGLRLPFGSAILTLIAVAAVGYHCYRYLATRAVEAEIAAVRPYCQLVTCKWGKCGRGERLACSEVSATLGPDQRVRRFEEAKMEFNGRNGQRRAVWAEIGTVIEGRVRVGDNVNVHIIDLLGGEPEVTNRPSLLLTLFGLGAFLFFLSIGARGYQHRWVRSSY